MWEAGIVGAVGFEKIFHFHESEFCAAGSIDGECPIYAPMDARIGRVNSFVARIYRAQFSTNKIQLRTLAEGEIIRHG